MVNRLNEKGLIRLERRRKEILEWRSFTHPKEANNFFSWFPPVLPYYLRIDIKDQGGKEHHW